MKQRTDDKTITEAIAHTCHFELKLSHAICLYCGARFMYNHSEQHINDRMLDHFEFIHAFGRK